MALMHINRIILFMMLFIVACNRDHISERAQVISTSNEILIAIVDSSTVPSRFVDGVKLAIEELNESGTFAKPVKPIYFDDKGSLEKAQRIAWSIAENPNFTAVVGHFSSKIAISASITYENNGIVFIAPKATQGDLLRDKNEYTFRNIPSDKIFGQEMAKYAHQKNFKRMIVIYERESFGKRFAEIFQKYGDALGIDFVSVKSYSPWKMDFRELISDLLDEDPFDAILLCGNMPLSAYIVKQLREMGIHVPIIGSDTLDSMQLLNIAGKFANGVHVPTVFVPQITNKLTRNFVDNFKYTYGFEPDTLAAQGYDAIKALGHAIEKGGSHIPIVIATTLRFLGKWQGVTGAYTFTQEGDITDKSIYFKTVQKEKFVFTAHESETKVSHTVKHIALKLPINKIGAIDPIQINHPASIDIAEQLFMGLTDLDPKTFEPVPELAMNWYSDDGYKTFTFELRDDVLWTDGTKVTAYDIEKTIKRNVQTKMKSPDARLLYIIKNAQGLENGSLTDYSKMGVKALDSDLIEFVLEHEAAYFPKIVSLWMFWPIPMTTYDKHGELWTHPGNIQTNGPYKIHDWVEKTQLILQKNKLYCDADKVSIPEIHYYVIKDHFQGLPMYFNGDIDIVGGMYLELPKEYLERMPDNLFLSDHISEIPALCSDILIFNTDKTPMDHVLVRKAIAFATNRRLIINSLDNHSAHIASSFIPEAVLQSGKNDQNKYGFDPVKANKSLSEAGYHDGVHFPEISILFEDSQHNERISRSFQSLLSHYLNITVHLRPMKHLSPEYHFKDNEIMHLRLCADYPDPSSFFNSVRRITGIKNEKVTHLLKEASKISQLKKQKNLYNEAARIMIEKTCVVIPICSQHRSILVQPKIKGFYPMPFGGQHIRHWEISH